MEKISQAVFSVVKTCFNRSKTVHPAFGNAACIYILCPPHCLYIASLIIDSLSQHGIKSKIIGRRSKTGFDHTLHIVVCPQIFKDLPKNYIAFQVEQSIHQRWFTPEYFHLLNKAKFIFDYSETNIKFLQNHISNPTKIHYLPLSHLKGFGSEISDSSKKYSVLFYGDASNHRRKKFLDEIKKHHDVTIVHGLYGEAVYREIKKAKIIVNIHFYENALLETTRIYESLSLGAMVISEKGIDQDEHSNLTDLVDFVEINDVNSMVSKINIWLGAEDQLLEKTTENQVKLFKTANRFHDAFSKFLFKESAV